MRIPLAHAVALESVFRQKKPRITLQRLQELYTLATTAAPSDDSTVASSIAASAFTINTTMDRRTGIFVQLVSTGTLAPLLTIGKRWAIEQLNPALNNTSITLISHE